VTSLRFALPELPDWLWLRFAATLLLAAMVAAAAASGSFRPFERRLDEITFALFERPASDQVHVVEMDAASMAAIQSWPWSRDHYARMLQQLDAAGVRSISIDVDFSGRGDAAGDAAFGAAIANANAPVVLPTFAQNASFRTGRQLDSLPIAPLRDHAQLASISVVPDADGFVRRMPMGTVTGALARPSIAAMISGRAGEAGTSFPIDFAVDPATVPRHSFIAIERGMFDSAALKGKDVIVGATAVEMGDRYPVPHHGVIPGVIIQALAAETLADAVPTYGGWMVPLAGATLLALLAGSALHRGRVVQRAATGVAIILLLWLGARVLGATWFEIVPALTLMGAATVLRLALLSHRLAVERKRVDPESGLPNRLALDAQPRLPDDRFLIAAQIDDFDALTLAVGARNCGELLRRLVERLTVTTSAATVYRIDDRTLMWSTPLEISEIEPLMSGLRAMLRSPIEVAGQRLGVSMTFGVAATDHRGAVPNAAHAASLARRSGKPWRLHSDGEGENAAQQFSLLGELEDALRNGEITVLYQPKLNLSTGRIDAAEALVRWQHPVRGMLPPDCFIPVIEEAGRIDDLTIEVLAQAITAMRGWSQQGLSIGVAVNISAGLLASDGFAAKVLAMVNRAKVPAHSLTFEVTESAQFEDSDTAIAMLERFRAAGIKISMDDYGTGQSTLNYLKMLPVSELKIDRSFVAQAHIDKGDAMLVRSTVQLAHELAITVVAEGVEDPACLDFLKTIGCDYAQGYLVGRPLTATGLTLAVSQPFDIAA
jgi:EAL domain-containing protein (putative c-di-GMP-specific phosphodiesterase class I)/CHASE2 domain-containing sensor protein